MIIIIYGHKEEDIIIFAIICVFHTVGHFSPNITVYLRGLAQLICLIDL